MKSGFQMNFTESSEVTVLSSLSLTLSIRAQSTAGRQLPVSRKLEFADSDATH